MILMNIDEWDVLDHEFFDIVINYRNIYEWDIQWVFIPNSRACWVSISRAGAGSRGLAAFKIRNGTLEPWNPGTLEPWNPGTLNPGTLNLGTLEPWNPGPWNPGP